MSRPLAAAVALALGCGGSTPASSPPGQTETETAPAEAPTEAPAPAEAPEPADEMPATPAVPAAVEGSYQLAPSPLGEPLESADGVLLLDRSKPIPQLRDLPDQPARVAVAHGDAAAAHPVALARGDARRVGLVVSLEPRQIVVGFPGTESVELPRQDDWQAQVAGALAQLLRHRVEPEAGIYSADDTVTELVQLLDLLHAVGVEQAMVVGRRAYWGRTVAPGPAPATRFRFVAPEVSGPLDPVIVREYIGRKGEMAETCVAAQSLAPDRELRFDVTFAIMPDGRVKGAKASIPDKVAACAVSAVQVVLFPKPKGGGMVEVRAPVIIGKAAP